MRTRKLLLAADGHIVEHFHFIMHQSVEEQQSGATLEKLCLTSQGCVIARRHSHFNDPTHPASEEGGLLKLRIMKQTFYRRAEREAAAVSPRVETNERTYVCEDGRVPL